MLKSLSDAVFGSGVKMALDFGSIQLSALCAHFSALQHMHICGTAINHLQRCGSRSSGQNSHRHSLLPSLWTQQWQAIGGLPSLHIHLHPHRTLH